MNVSRTVTFETNYTKLYLWTVISHETERMMYVQQHIFFSCNKNIWNQGHNIGPLNFHNLQKIHSPLHRNTTLSQTNNKIMQTSTEKDMKSFVHTSAKTYRNRKQLLFKNCPDIRLPCEHWTIWQIWHNKRKSILFI